LSIHASGFVQFSGKGVKSGIDNITGVGKGVSLQSTPLTRPVNTGPTCAVQLWGLEKGYETVKKLASNDFVYTKTDFVIRKYSSEDTNFNTYLFEFFVFSKNYLNRIRKTSVGEEITLKFPNYIHKRNAKFTLRVIRLRNLDSFIGVLPPFLTQTFFQDRFDFGFFLGSPAEKSKEYEGVWNVIHAICPSFLAVDLEYLDYSEESKI
jgi:hypothetical protein